MEGKKCLSVIRSMRTANASAMNVVADLVAGMRILSCTTGDDDKEKSEISATEADCRVTDVYAMVKDTVDMIHLAHKIFDSVSLTYSIVPMVSKTVHLDVCVQRMLMNLLSNAVLHTAEGLIHVEVLLCAGNSSREQQMMQFKVRDTGEGIDPEHLGSVFDAFISHGGSVGLGLFLVKQQSLRLGGSCGVDSNLGQGTEAWFRVPYILPMLDAQASIKRSSDTRERTLAGGVGVIDGGSTTSALQNQPSSSEPPAVPATEKANDTAEGISIHVDCENNMPIKILVVDDVRPTQQLHALALETCGYEVDLACNANEGFARMTEKVYTLVLCDIYMRRDHLT